MADTELAFRLRPVSETDTFNSLRTGDDAFKPLKIFARKKARKYEAANLARTYVVVDEATDCLAAYITLVCSEVASQAPLLPDGEPEFPHEHYPAVKIARLMVDARYRDGIGLGRMLVEFAIGLARVEICPAIGCRFVVVDSKQASVKFYEKCGFTLVDTAGNRERSDPVMFLDLHKAAAA